MDRLPKGELYVGEGYLNLNLKFLYMTGLWPKKAIIGRLTLLSISIIAMFLAFFFGTVVEVYRSLGDFLVVTECLGIAFLVAVTFHKYLMLIQYEDEFKQLVSTVNRYFFMSEQRQRAKHLQIVQVQDNHARRLTLGFFFLCLSTVIGFTLVPLTEAFYYRNNSNSTEPYFWRFPYKISFPFDTSSNVMYIIVYLYHGYVGLVHIFLIPACDNFVASLMCHVVGQFRILKDSLQNIRNYATAKVEGMKYGDTANIEVLKEDQEEDDDDKEENQEVSIDAPDFHTSDDVHREMHRALKNCVTHHQTILRFVDVLEHVMNRVMLSQFFASSMMFCTAAFHLTTPGKNKLMLMVSMGGLISGALTQLGMFCYFGDQVQEESEAVAFAAYSAQWYHATPSVKRSIGIIMSRSQKPAILTMGKFADLSLDTFATILRGSYAYFAMLNELNG